MNAKERRVGGKFDRRERNDNHCLAEHRSENDSQYRSGSTLWREQDPVCTDRLLRATAYHSKKMGTLLMCELRQRGTEELFECTSVCGAKLIKRSFGGSWLVTQIDQS
jgi:hypothetical protein